MKTEKTPNPIGLKVAWILGYSIAALCVCFVFLFIVNAVTPDPTPAAPQAKNEQSKVATPPTVAELLTLVNAERAKAGVATLAEDSQLDASAQYKAQDMKDRDYFAHADPTTGINNGLAKEKMLQPNCTYVSENIFWGRSTNTSESAVSWWVGSKPHHDAMLDPKYDTTGFGIADNKVVEHFCDLP